MKVIRGAIVGLLALASLLSIASVASALSISPSGAYTASSGATVLTFTSTGQRLTCTSSSISATISSTGSGSIPVGGMSYAGCSNGLLGSFTVANTVAVPISVILVRLGTTAGRLVGLLVRVPAGGVTLTAAGCRISVGGDVVFGRLYTGSGSPLSIVVNPTDVFTNLAASTSLTTTSTTCSPAVTVAGLGATYSASYTLSRAATVTE